MKKIANEYTVYTPEELNNTCITMWRQGIDKTLELLDYHEPFLTSEQVEWVYDYAVTHNLVYVFNKYGDLDGIAIEEDTELIYVTSERDVELYEEQRLTA